MSEESRALQYRLEKTAREKWECDMNAALAGDPVRRLALQVAWLPIIDPVRGWDPVRYCEAGEQRA